jgi:hypothetical protein
VDEDEVEVESFDEEMVSFLFENDEEMGSMPCRGVYLKQKKNEPCMCAVRTRCTAGRQSLFDDLIFL